MKKFGTCGCGGKVDRELGRIVGLQQAERLKAEYDVRDPITAESGLNV